MSYYTFLSLLFSRWSWDVIYEVISNPELLSKNISYLNVKLLHYIENQNLDMIEFLIHQGAYDHQYFSPCIHTAVMLGNLEIVKILIDNCTPVSIENDLPLYTACEFGHLHIVKYLVCQGANISNRHNLCFKIANKKEFSQIVEYLISQGADTSYQLGNNLTDNNSITKSLIANNTYNSDFIDIQNAIFDAVEYGKYQKFNILFNTIKIVPYDSYYIMISAFYGNVAIFKLIMDKLGEDMIKHCNRSILDIIIDNEHIELMKFLIEKDLITTNYDELFKQAVENDKKEIIKLLESQKINKK